MHSASKTKDSTTNSFKEIKKQEIKKALANQQKLKINGNQKSLNESHMKL